MVDTVHLSAICATDAPVRARTSGTPPIFWLASRPGEAPARRWRSAIACLVTRARIPMTT